MPGLPFDDSRAVIPNMMGRVQSFSPDGSAAGVYCTGWIKRGPSGIIGSNLICAEETVAMVEEDVQGRGGSGGRAVAGPRRGAEGLKALLSERKVCAQCCALV